MQKQFSEVNIFIFVAAISLLGVFILPDTIKAWSVDWNYPQNTSAYVRISANPSSVISGGFTTLSWISKNVSACTKTGDWSGSASTSGSETVMVNKGSVYEITCSKNSGGIVYDSIKMSINNPYYSPSYTYASPQYNNGSSSNTSHIAYYSSSSGQTTSNISTSSDASHNSNLNLNIKSRDFFMSSSFAKEIASQPDRLLDFKIEINNKSTSKLGRMFIALPSRLSYVNGSAYLNGAKLSQNIITSGIDLSPLNAMSLNTLTFQATVASGSAFSENTTILTVNASVKSLNDSAYIASDYTNVLIYKNSMSDEAMILGASTVNTGTGNTLLISLLTGIVAAALYALFRFHNKLSQKLSGKIGDNRACRFIKT